MHYFTNVRAAIFFVFEKNKLFLLRCDFHLALKMHSMLNCGSVCLTLFYSQKFSNRTGMHRRLMHSTHRKRETNGAALIINIIIMFSYAIRKKCVARLLVSRFFLASCCCYSSCEGFSNVHTLGCSFILIRLYCLCNRK